MAGSRSSAAGTRTAGSAEAGARSSQSASSRSSASPANTAASKSAATLVVDGAAAVNVMSAARGGDGDGRAADGGGRKTKKRSRKKKRGGSAADPATANDSRRSVQNTGTVADGRHSDSSSEMDVDSQLTKITMVSHIIDMLLTAIACHFGGGSVFTAVCLSLQKDNSTSLGWIFKKFGNKQIVVDTRSLEVLQNIFLIFYCFRSSVSQMISKMKVQLGKPVAVQCGKISSSVPAVCR